jgi:hypothetical protein
MIGDELIVVLPPGEDVGPDVNVIKLFSLSRTNTLAYRIICPFNKTHLMAS